MFVVREGIGEGLEMPCRGLRHEKSYNLNSLKLRMLSFSFKSILQPNQAWLWALEAGCLRHSRCGSDIRSRWYRVRAALCLAGDLRGMLDVTLTLLWLEQALRPQMPAHTWSC